MYQTTRKWYTYKSTPKVGWTASRTVCNDVCAGLCARHHFDTDLDTTQVSASLRVSVCDHVNSPGPFGSSKLFSRHQFLDGNYISGNHFLIVLRVVFVWLVTSGASKLVTPVFAAL